LKYLQGHIHTYKSRILLEAISIKLSADSSFLVVIITSIKVHNKKGGTQHTDLHKKIAYLSQNSVILQSRCVVGPFTHITASHLFF